MSTASAVPPRQPPEPPDAPAVERPSLTPDPGDGVFGSMGGGTPPSFEPREVPNSPTTATANMLAAMGSMHRARTLQAQVAAAAHLCPASARL